MKINMAGGYIISPLKSPKNTRPTFSSSSLGTIAKSFCLVIVLVLFSCGIPRSEYDKVKEEHAVEKKALQTQVSALMAEVQQLKIQLAEKEAQYSALFFRFESLSSEYLKLKRIIETPQPAL